jgi:hypothetical protein
MALCLEDRLVHRYGWKSNKTYMKKRFVPQVGYLHGLYRDARSTEYKKGGFRSLIVFSYFHFTAIFFQYLEGTGK